MEGKRQKRKRVKKFDVQLSVKISSKQLEKLEYEADQQGEDISAIVRGLIDKYLADPPKG